MGLKDLFSRWTEGDDERAIERAKLDSELSPEERAEEEEDFEARKDDTAAESSWAGREAEGAERGELED